MKIKSLWIPFALFLLAAVPLRVYQVAYLIDPATGFFESGESLYQIPRSFNSAEIFFPVFSPWPPPRRWRRTPARIC